MTAGSGASRRDVLKWGLSIGGLAMVPGLAACGSSESKSGNGGAKASTKVVFADYGGTTREAQVEAYYKEFTKRTGIEVVSATADPAKFILMAKSGSSQWDLMTAGGFLAIQYIGDGLMEKLDPSVTRCDRVPEEYQDYIAGGYAQSYNIGFRTDAYDGKKPETWADFWDTEKFPGKRAFPGIYSATIEAALLADGVEPDQLFPLDFDRGFAKLDELRDHLLMFNDFGQGQQFLQANSVGMALLPIGRISALQDQGVPVETVWNHAITDLYTAAAIPTGAPHLDAAFKLVDHMSQPETQAEFARLSGYAPTQSAAFDLLDEKTLSRLPATPEHLKIAAVRDLKILAEQQPEYVKRFTAWLAG